MRKNKIGVIVLALTTIIGTSIIDVNAATTYAEELPETIIRKSRSEEYWFKDAGINNTDGKTNTVIEFLSNDDKYLLYCSDRNNPNTAEQVTLTKGQKMDYKYAYLLKYIESNGNLVDGITYEALTSSGQSPEENPSATKANEMANIWIAQIALWNMQGTIGQSDFNGNALIFTKLQRTDFKLKNSAGNVISSGMLWNKVIELVNKANSAEEPSSTKIEPKVEGEWTNSDNISKSGLIILNPTGSNVSEFKLALENAPEGTKMYLEDGTEITEANSTVSGNAKIYLTVDKSKLDKSKEYNFNINIDASVANDVAYQYVDISNQCSGQTCQPSILVGPEPVNISGAIPIKLLPDTANSLSKSIYYLGFLILLIGAGTIYANVRPKKEETE